MNELAKKVIKLTNSSSEIIYEDLPQNDPLEKTRYNSSNKKLNYHPKVNIENGLNKTISYFKNKMSKILVLGLDNLVHKFKLEYSDYIKVNNVSLHIEKIFQ